VKILIINKFLHHNGGSETYIFQIGDWLKNNGHEVEYFGMEHNGRCVGNSVDVYTTEMDFHTKSKFALISNTFKTIYSIEAREKIRRVLDSFSPDVCHLNNFNYQLTPTVILEIVKWRKQTGKNCRIIYTAHDYQLLCPNHMCHNPNTYENCEKCFGGHYTNCIKGRCVHGSIAKSVVGALEAWFWNMNGVYKYLDKIICCSKFLKEKMDVNPIFRDKTQTMHNFIKRKRKNIMPRKDYVLYFGRYSAEKGLNTLINACKNLPSIEFIFAGKGPLEDEMKGIDNIRDVGFLTGDKLELLIKEAKFSVYPSEWYENCPFSVMESQILGTPVLGANIGGIPELIQVGKTGELFESGNVEDLTNKIKSFRAEEYRMNCQGNLFDDIDDYCRKLMCLYMGDELQCQES